MARVNQHPNIPRPKIVGQDCIALSHTPRYTSPTLLQVCAKKRLQKQGNFEKVGGRGGEKKENLEKGGGGGGGGGFSVGVESERKAGTRQIHLNDTLWH